MEVQYDVIHKPKTGEHDWEQASIEYEGRRPEKFCCPNMRSAYGSSVRFGSHEDFIHDTSYVTMSVVWHCDEGSYHDDFKIDFCPFCGERITVKEGAHYDEVQHTRTETKDVNYFERRIR